MSAIQIYAFYSICPQNCVNILGFCRVQIMGANYSAITRTPIYAQRGATDLYSKDQLDVQITGIIMFTRVLVHFNENNLIGE